MWGLILAIILFVIVITLMCLSQSSLFPPEIKDIKEFIKKNTKRYGK